MGAKSGLQNDVSSLPFVGSCHFPDILLAAGKKKNPILTVKNLNLNVSDMMKGKELCTDEI